MANILTILTLNDFNVRADQVVYAVEPAFIDENRDRAEYSKSDNIGLIAQVYLADGTEMLVDFPGEYISNDPEGNQYKVNEAMLQFNQFIDDWKAAVSE